MDPTSKLNEPHYALPLPREHERHYIEDNYNETPEGIVGVNYLLDKNEKIVGFTHANRKFIFSNVVNHSGEILPDARFEFKKDHADEIIREYFDLYKNYKSILALKDRRQKEYSHHDVQLALDLGIEKTDNFNRVYGKEYGIRNQTYRGASFLENKNRSLIGFRYHGKDFFLNKEATRLSKRYKPEMTSYAQTIEDIEQSIDKYLDKTNLGLSDQPSAEEVAKTKDTLHDHADILHEQHQEVIKRKQEASDKHLRLVNNNASKKEISRHDYWRTHLDAFAQDLEKRLKTVESDIEKLSQFSQSVAIKSDEMHLNELKKQAILILHEASHTNDIEVLHEQFQKLKDINNEIESIEKKYKQ